ncbi:MAG: hypothetical protein Q8S15_05755 [Erysipelotrichaceae bacterium]|nr:hypothetical protein [Erysipelotrichaceae bacterium]MDP3305552.1 hypothetical protein [Erysipelotrichaceae bacterium]
MDYTLQHPEIYEIMDSKTNRIFYGCDQDWYTTKWQQLSGCGPTVATNMVIYILKKQFTTRLEYVQLMRDVRKYVTPKIGGVNRTSIYYRGLSRYFSNSDWSMDFRYLNVPKKSQRPSFDQITVFINYALEHDSPIAFLNLHNGKVKNLEAWHWTLIIESHLDNENDHTMVTILDNGEKKTIDLKLWYESTNNDGGFVYFENVLLNENTMNHRL